MTINLLIVAYTIQVEQLTLSNVITAVVKGQQLALAYPIVAIKQYAVQTNGIKLAEHVPIISKHTQYEVLTEGILLLQDSSTRDDSLNTQTV